MRRISIAAARGRDQQDADHRSQHLEIGGGAEQRPHLSRQRQLSVYRI